MNRTNQSHSVCCMTILLCIGIWFAETPLLAFSVNHSPQDSSDSQFRSSQDETAHGLIGEFQFDSGDRFQRIDKHLNFDWADRNPDERANSRSFKVTWNGFFAAEGNGKFWFAANCSGKIQLKIDDKKVLDFRSQPSNHWVESSPIELSFGEHKIEVIYQSSSESTANNNSKMQLLLKGEDFEWEPIGYKRLSHSKKDLRDDEGSAFELGKQLTRALRCDACHKIGNRQSSPLAAPSLKKGSVPATKGWIQNWLLKHQTAKGAHGQTDLQNRMPNFKLSRQDAVDLEAYLISDNRKPAKKDVSKKQKELGKELFLTLGCLACHTQNGEGSKTLFSGGDLSDVGSKRSAGWLLKWLQNPQSIQKQHRMPVFDFKKNEAQALAAFLSTSQTAKANTKDSDESSEDSQLIGSADRGLKLWKENNCASCHQTQSSATGFAANLTPISAASQWQASCVTEIEGSSPKNKDRIQPSYRLKKHEKLAIKTYVSGIAAKAQNQKGNHPLSPDRSFALIENNCLACHQRNEYAGLVPMLTRLTQSHPQLAKRFSALRPPSLNSAGDKFEQESLEKLIGRPDNSYRSYLTVRMPKFQNHQKAIGEISRHLIATDRRGSKADHNKTLAGKLKRVTSSELNVAGSRLVGNRGFGCTSCHAIGNSIPPKAPNGAIGPNLSLIEKRMTPQWFARWSKNPARIVEGMEMPSIQVPASNILGEDVDLQLAAVWKVINDPNFQPPSANPIRVAQLSGNRSQKSPPITLTDVLQKGKRKWIKPFLIGLPNRNNVLFDLERGSLSQWTIGDTASQQTQGKTWYWELGGAMMLDNPSPFLEFGIASSEFNAVPITNGQFLTEPDRWWHTGESTRLRHRLFFTSRSEEADQRQKRDRLILNMEQSFAPIWKNESNLANGFLRQIKIQNLPDSAAFTIRLADRSQIAKVTFDTVQLSDTESIRVRKTTGTQKLKKLSSDGIVTLIPANSGGVVTVEIEYLTTTPPDVLGLQTFDENDQEYKPETRPVELNLIPGFKTHRLPLEEDWMPTGIDFYKDKVFVSSLKGRVWIASDSDGDGFADTSRPITDELAAPFGLKVNHFASANQSRLYMDVVNKFGLVQIDLDENYNATQYQLAASGWGHTDDYHDWAIGLPRDRRGGYLMATACQQDLRSKAAAKYRGKVLRLVSREPTHDNPRQFAIQEISSGHRFPIGIAVNSESEAFVTDNQGNYNPFNELNHVQLGKHFGFINKLDPQKEIQLTQPAIDIPHPWTRSVNGICFLEVEQLLSVPNQLSMGPFEGHLVGCEYDTRRLIRMSLQNVDGVIQGACYPFTSKQLRETDSLLGPLTCAVSPKGELYIGCIRDSGWGAGGNIGTLVRATFDSASLPSGIQEINANPDGFEISFLKPVNGDKSSLIENFQIVAATRRSTPAYGGSDIDRHKVKVNKVEVSDDRKSIQLYIDNLKPDYVYQFQLKDISSAPNFFPAEAFYTLRKVPARK